MSVDHSRRKCPAYQLAFIRRPSQNKTVRMLHCEVVYKKYAGSGLIDPGVNVQPVVVGILCARLNITKHCCKASG